MGIDRSTHRALIYGPSEYGGFGVRHLYTEMMGMKLDTIISHLRAGTQLGTLLLITITIYNYTQESENLFFNVETTFCTFQ
jgi:hypothetical protein